MAEKLKGAALVSAAEDIAIRAHSGQVDKAGEPYITHPARVVQYVDEIVRDNFDVLADKIGAEVLENECFMSDLYAIAWLHDVIEDSEYSADDLLIRMIPERVVEAVVRLSKRKNEPNVDYYARVKQDTLARIVKLADVCDNSNPDRLALIDDKEIRHRLIDKYDKARAHLSFGEDSADIVEIIAVEASD